jgi:ABC-type sugar transport system ATPase subunit
VLVVSEELDELFEICDRIAVIAQGRLSEAHPVAQTDAEAVGLMMSGAFVPASSPRSTPVSVAHAGDDSLAAGA